MENKQAEAFVNLITEALGLSTHNKHTSAMLDHVGDFFEIVRLDAGKIATLQQEEANTTLYCDDPNCIACQIHLKKLVAKNREILILMDTILRPYKKQFAILFGEMHEIRKAGEKYVAHVEASRDN
jgi:hypothetical protein